MTSAGVITISNLTATQNFAKLELSDNGTDFYDYTLYGVGDATNAIVDASAYDENTGGTTKVSMGTSWTSVWTGQSIIARVTLSDATTKSVTTTWD